MAKIPTMKHKICLLGEGSVGKSSLIKRFVFDQFTDGYVTTIGTKVTKKELNVSHPETGDKFKITMLIWDIMGQKGFREILKETYFFGTQGAIAVCDITRKDTMYELRGWINSLYDVSNNVPVIFIGNKSDLMDSAEFKIEELADFASDFESSTFLLSSAKTGINVNLAFKILAERIVEKSLASRIG
jgi:small GTP-binding protein